MKKKNVLSIGKLATVIFVVLCLAASCKKDASSGTSSPEVTVTEDDAADAITEAVTPQTAGVTAQVSDATVLASSAAYPCGLAFDSAIIRSSGAGAAIAYSFSLQWNWKLTCASPANFTASFKGKSSYDAVRMSSADSSSGSFTITGLTLADGFYTFNQTYMREGSQQSKIGNKNLFTSTIIITSTDIKVSKSTQQITSGTAIASISGASSSGKSFSYSGTITFTGSKTATLTLKSGASYNIAW